MQNISGPGQNSITSAFQLIFGILRFLVVSFLGLLAIVIGIIAFLIFFIPLLIYILITKRKLFNTIKNTKAKFTSASSASGPQIFSNFNRSKDFRQNVYAEEEVDIDIPAKEKS